MHAIYQMEQGGRLVSAVTMRWEGEIAEILTLAVAAEDKGRGLGRQIVLWLADEARRRRKRRLTVGTINTSLGNIAFYQGCGKCYGQCAANYFWYYHEPVFEHGIQKRDLLVLRLALTEVEGSPRTRRWRESGNGRVEKRPWVSLCHG